VTQSTDAIVIGSGALGASIAYVLARAGYRIIMVDRHEMASQTSPRAAGLSAVMRSTPLMTRLAVRGVELLHHFVDESGLDIGLVRSGSLKVARDAASAEQLREEVQRAKEFNVTARLIGAQEATTLMPLLRADHAAAIAHYPDDVYLDPARFNRGVIQAAAQQGCILLPKTPVEEIVTANEHVAGVRTSLGMLAAPIVVDAAGAWARALVRFAAMPMIAVRHQLLVTRPLADVRPTQPITRVLDLNVYVRPCDGGLMLGGYESTPLLLEDVPADVTQMPLDLAVLRAMAASVSHEFPALTDLEGATLRGGMPTMTLDDEHIIGPVPGAAGLYIMGGCNVGGLSTALAFAEALSGVISNPEAAGEIAPLLPARFVGREVSDAALRDACRLNYAQHYQRRGRRA
jgi:glycine/D-amino acid oxidase-like deaminating enzyme